MRLIGSFNTEQEAYAFYSFLLKENIQNIYEPFLEGTSGQKHYRVWVYDENDLERAMAWMQKYKETPSDPQFQIQMPSSPKNTAPPSPEYAEISEKEELKWRSVPSIPVKRRRLPFTLTNLIIILCGFLFLWNDFEEAQIIKDKGEFAVEIALTPMMHKLLFDVPSSYHYVEEFLERFPVSTYKTEKDLPPEALSLLKEAEDTASWNGIYPYLKGKKQPVKMFEKIRQGEVWRLFTPCLLHRDFLHILFNMLWVWILSKQIEERLRKSKLCLLILIIGIISNTTQYLMSGPYFMGFSGVVVGMAGFIWVRQKVAPWEGYPLQKSTALFLLLFVLAMFALEVFTFSLSALSVLQISPSIANTAHIVGGLVGMALGKMRFFSRRAS